MKLTSRSRSIDVALINDSPHLCTNGLSSCGQEKSVLHGNYFALRVVINWDIFICNSYLISREPFGHQFNGTYCCCSLLVYLRSLPRGCKFANAHALWHKLRIGNEALKVLQEVSLCSSIGSLLILNYFYIHSMLGYSIAWSQAILCDDDTFAVFLAECLGLWKLGFGNTTTTRNS